MNDIIQFNRRIRGSRAKKEGQDFETKFARACKLQGIYRRKIPSGYEGWKKSWKPVTTPCDFFLIKNSTSVFVDCKSFDNKTLTHSMLTEHQVKELLEIINSGCLAGYLVFFRPLDKIVFFDAHQLTNLVYGESLSQDDGLILGSLDDMNLNLLFNEP